MKDFLKEITQRSITLHKGAYIVPVAHSFQSFLLQQSPRRDSRAT